MQGSDRDAENPLEKLTAADNREWVQLMIERGRGTTVGDIMDDSPEKLMLTEQNPDAAAAMQLHAILAAEREVKDMRFDIVDEFWFGSDRVHGRIVSAFELHNKTATVANGLYPLPNFIIPNAIMREDAVSKEMRQSAPDDVAVKFTRLMVIKFDALTEEEQTAFWGGVLKTDVFRVVTLVSSGDKTIHTLVEVEGEYGAFMERVLRLCCSSEDVRYRCDPTTLHPSALTCLAGARSLDTGRYQELLFARCS